MTRIFTIQVSLAGEGTWEREGQHKSGIKNKIAEKLDNLIWRKKTENVKSSLWIL